MKVFLQRAVSVASNVDSTVASFNINPETLVKCLLDHPLLGPPAVIPSGTLTPFYPAGGLKTPGYSGIRLQSTTALIPFKCNYFRTTAASKYYTTTSNTPPSFQNLPDLYLGLLGSANYNGVLSPDLGPYGIVTGYVTPFTDKLLNVTPGGSTVVETSASQEAGISDWALGVTRVGYPSSNATNPTNYALDSYYRSLNVWDLTNFKTYLPFANMTFAASASEYYEIEFDSSVLSNNPSALTDLYLIIPVSLQPVNPWTAPSYGCTDRIPKSDAASGASYTEWIIPISTLISANSVSTQTANFPSTTGQAAISSVILGLELNYSAKLSASTTPFPETLLLNAPLSVGTPNS